MKVNHFSFTRAGDGLRWFPRPAARAVNTLAIFAEPCADLLQHFDLTRFDAAVRHRADIEQKISITTGALRKDADHFAG